MRLFICRSHQAVDTSHALLISLYAAKTGHASNPSLFAGASKSLLSEKTVHKEHLEASAEGGQGLLLSCFHKMHAAIMRKAEEGNRYEWTPSVC